VDEDRQQTLGQSPALCAHLPQPARSSLAGPRRVLPTFFQHLMPVFHFSYRKRNEQPHA
jgi:hypothetical protein